MWLRLGFRALPAPADHNQSNAGWTERRQEPAGGGETPGGR